MSLILQVPNDISSTVVSWAKDRAVFRSLSVDQLTATTAAVGVRRGDLKYFKALKVCVG